MYLSDTVKAALVLTAILPTILAQVDFNEPPDCASGLQVITACGTYQKGYGTILGLTENVTSLVSDSTSVYLDYPANESPYYASVAAGVKNLTKYIEYFVDACPDINLVLIGYSQGAQVSLSTLCGWPGGLLGFGSVTPIASKYQDRIVAVVAYGDPTHVYPNAIDEGTSTHDGIFPRALQCPDSLAAKTASWCDRGDEFCDACPPPLTPQSSNPRGCNASVHQSYWNIYNGDATTWVQGKFSNQSTPGGTSTTTPGQTATSASAATATSTSGAVSLKLQLPWLLRVIS